MNNFTGYMQAINWIVRILLSAAFVVSGIVKLYPIEFFENDLLMHNLASDTWVMFEARWLIGLELIIGVGILFVLWDRLFLACSFAMLIFYTVYLLIILGIEGNSGNCGCFGNAIVLTPLEGVIKNVVFAAFTFWLWKHKSNWHFRYRSVALVFILLAGLALPFILNPVFFPQKVNTVNGEKSVVPLEKLYATSESPTVQLDQGKQIVAFLLLNCSHCRLAASRLEAIKRDHPELPMHFILCGEDEDLKGFIDETRLSSVPYTHIHSLHLAMNVSGPDFPSVYLLNNSVADAKLGFFDIETKSLLDWYNQP
jgi:hypothetical protein